MECAAVLFHPIDFATLSSIHLFAALVLLHLDLWFRRLHKVLFIFLACFSLLWLMDESPMYLPIDFVTRSVRAVLAGATRLEVL